MNGAALDWNRVAEERGADARALYEKARMLAAIYMLGYHIECNLKAYLAQKGKPFPTYGREGHNLRGLWEAAGFKTHDLFGERRWFVAEWDTGLRYRLCLPLAVDPSELYRAGVKLAGYIQLQMRRSAGRRK